MEVLGSPDKSSVTRYNKYAGRVSKSFGDGPDDIVPADTTIQYILALLVEKKEVHPDMTFAMTQSLATMAFTDSSMETTVGDGDLQSMEVVSSTIVTTYKEAASKIISGGIYSVLNAGNWEGSNLAHQNWLYLSFDEKTLLRFEPSAEYAEFRINELCDMIIRKMGAGWKWEMAIEHRLNTFMGCRAFSTLLAAMYIEGVDFKNLDKFKQKVNGKFETRGKLTKPFVVLMQAEIQEKLECTKSVVIPRSVRTRKGVEPTYKFILV
jgi:hypothetical protein